MDIDGHDKDPLIDLSEKIQYKGSNPTEAGGSTPPTFPILSRIPQSGVGAIDQDSLRAVQQAVSEAMRGITINNVKPTINGGEIRFDIEIPKIPTPPPISETTHNPPPSVPVVPELPSISIPVPDKVDINIQRTNADVGFRGINGDFEKPKDDATDGGGGRNDNSNKGELSKFLDNDDRKGGESKREYKERQNERKDLEKTPDVAAAIANGDTSFFSSGFVPVLFTRADGQRKILTYVLEDNSEVVEGAAPGEKAGALPATNAYYTSQGESTHPWKVTDAGGGSATVAAGRVLGYYLTYAASEFWPGGSSGYGTYLPEDIVLGPSANYNGGAVAIGGADYIYALIPRNGPTKEYAEFGSESDLIIEIELGDALEPGFGDGVSVVTSTDDPSTYSPPGNQAAICIAQVSNPGGQDPVLAIIQYVTHNPTMFLPVINGNISVNSP